MSGNEVQSVTEEVVDDVEENEGEEVTVSRNGDAGQDLIVDDKEIRVLEEEGKNKSAEDEVVIENKAILTEVIQEENNVKDSLVFEGGDGTIDNPYQISNAEQLDAIRNDLSANYILIKDIDLNDWECWIPIGTESFPFQGGIDGNSYKISNLSMNNETIINMDSSDVTSVCGGYGVGLFGVVDSGARITNIKLESVSIEITLENMNISCGAIVGKVPSNAVDINIEKCIVTGICNVSSTYHYLSCLGGIIGYVPSMEGTICECEYNGELYIYAYGARCGGIGGVINLTVVQDCINRGSVNCYENVRTGGACAGGIIGEASYSSIIGCTNYGNIFSIDSNTSSGISGGITGIGGYIKKGTNYGKVEASGYSSGVAGGICGKHSDVDLFIKESLNYGLDIKGSSELYSGRICGNTIGGLEKNYSINTTLVNGNTPGNDIGLDKKNGASFIEGTVPWEMEFSEIAPTIWFTFETDKELEYTEGIGYNYSQFNMDIAALCMIPLDNSDPTYENVTVTIELPEGLSFSEDANEKSMQKNLGTMSLSGTKRQDMSIPVYLDNNYFADEFEIKVSVTADGYTDSQSNTYYVSVKEVPNYDLYDIQIYSEFSNCNIGVEQTMLLIPAMVKDDEPLKGEDGWTFTVKNEEVVEIQEYVDTEYGPAVRVKGKKQGNTELNILHISTGRSISIVINVVDTTEYFNVTWLEKIEEDHGIYNAGIYMENFKTSRRGKGYDVSFDAYNGITLYGAVEVYNAQGELIEVERIDKFEQYQTGLKEVVLDFGNLLYTAFNGTISSYKNTMYSKETNIEVWVPDDGYIYVSNNMSKSMGAYIYNMVDLSIWAFSVGNDVEKALASSENKDAIIENTSKNVMKQYIEAIKSEVITDATKEKFQEKLYKSLNKDVTKDLMSDLAGQLVADSDAFFEELDIDLWEEVTDVAVDYGDGVLVEAFEKVGGPAGVVLSGIFKSSEYLNRFMQFVQIVKTKDAKEVKIYIDVNNDKLVSNDVIVENEEGEPIANNTLVVTDISEDENSQYILENFQNESKVKILDITMYRDNEEVQPDGKIRVKIPIPALYDKDKCIVYRAESDGTFTNMEAYYEDGFMVFETSHLSKYLLVEEFVYSIVFDGNGASLGKVEPLNNLKKDIEYILPLNKFVRTGYVFDGWNTNKEGLGISYMDGAAIKNLSEENGGIITLFAQWKEDSENDILSEDLPSDGIIPDGIWSAGITDQTYTGSNITQSFRVYDGTKLLKEKTDYTLSYKNNKNAYIYLDEDYAAFEEKLKNTGKKVKIGTFDPAKAPQVTIKMKGNYSGSKTIYFKIEQADISGAGFEIADLTVTYTGKKQTPKPILTWNGKALKYGTDFCIPEYDNAKNDKKAFTEPQSEPYKLTVTGKKNFTGEIPITLTISNSTKQIAMNKVTVKGITNQKWNGGQITQTGFKVSYGKDVLTEENGDYTISWGANRAVGTGTVTFTGTGQDTDGDGLSYIGTKTVTFKITGTAMSKVTVTGVEKSYPFTGTAIEPAASLSYKANKNVDSVSLTEGIHYTVDYQKNVDKGTATIVFTGMESGGYTGMKKYTFKITAAGVSDITNGDVVTEQIHVTFKDTENVRDGIYIAPYMKGGAKPEVIVTSGGRTLEQNIDYTISYANNKKPALSTDKNAPSLTVKGKGNFTGSKKVYFTIAPKALTNENGIKVVSNDKIVSSKQNGYRQSFKVYDSDGKALGSADYDAGKVVYTLIETQNEDGTIKEENIILDKTSIVPANSTIRITVPGKGNYAGGEAYATYRILENNHDISKATIQIQNQDYTGNPVLITEQSQFKPGKVYIKIGKETKELILGEDIQVVPGSYVKHVDKGTAKVTFRGINDFGGTKTVSYKIGARSIEEFWKGIRARMARIFD